MTINSAEGFVILILTFSITFHSVESFGMNFKKGSSLLLPLLGYDIKATDQPTPDCCNPTIEPGQKNNCDEWKCPEKGIMENHGNCNCQPKNCDTACSSQGQTIFEKSSCNCPKFSSGSLSLQKPRDYFESSEYSAEIKQSPGKCSTCATNPQRPKITVNKNSLKNPGACNYPRCSGSSECEDFEECDDSSEEEAKICNLKTSQSRDLCRTKLQEARLAFGPLIRPIEAFVREKSRIAAPEEKRLLFEKSTSGSESSPCVDSRCSGDCSRCLRNYHR